MKSFKKNWIKKIIVQLESGANFVCPLYKRSRFEGNTTNHFVLPVLHSLYGYVLRQAIGGDYGFDIKYINEILKNKFTTHIKLYGIDIFMVISAIMNNLSIKEVKLGKKVHAPSYMKMEKIFRNVLIGVIESYRIYGAKIVNNEYEYYNSITIKRKCNFYNNIEIKYNDYIKSLSINDNYDSIRTIWMEKLLYLINNITSIDDNRINEIEKAFICRSFSFWKKYKNKSSSKCEEELRNFMNYVGGKNEINN